jgi:hypothetical protein
MSASSLCFNLHPCPPRLSASTFTHVPLVSVVESTVLYGAGFAGEVWGLEADPYAYAEAVRNVLANQHNNNTELWVENVHLRRMCVSNKKEVGW